MTRVSTKNQAIGLRKQGYSYSYISKKLLVSKSTLSDWLFDIQFTPNKYTINTIKKAHLASGAYKNKAKIESIEKAKLQAEKDIENISKRDLMMLGIGIYIGEGGKTHDLTRVINSDPKVILLMIKWLKSSFGVTTTQLKMRLHLYPDSLEEKCIEYWSKETGIPKSQFLKSMIDRRINKKEYKKGKLPYGTAHLSVSGLGKKEHGVYLHRLIMALISKILC